MTPSDPDDTTRPATFTDRELLLPDQRDDCLVVIYTKEATLLGKRFVLERNPTTVGRGAERHIQLDGESVSRRHCRFESWDDAWFVADDGSTNGTYLNDDPVAARSRLTNGDRIKVGSTIFKFLSGLDVEAQYHEEVYRLTIIDGLTSVYNKRYFLETLDREILRAKKHTRALSVLVLDIDHFKRTNEEYGPLAGDFILRELARVGQTLLRRDEILARLGGEEFGILLPEAPLEGALQQAETLRRRVQEHSFVFEGETMPVTISVGCTMLCDSEREVGALLKRAEEFLYEAKRSGRNRTQGGKDEASLHHFRRPFDGPTLFKKVREAGRSLDTTNTPVHASEDEATVRNVPYCAVVAFEIDDEALVHEMLGVKVYERWLQELLNDADTLAPERDLLGFWRDRFVLVATREADPNILLARIVDAWSARAVEAESAGRISRSLKTSLLTNTEIAERGERALDALVARLTARAVQPIGSSSQLPYPLAVFDSMRTSRRTNYTRVRTLLDGLEMAMRFLAVVELSAIRDYGCGAEQDAAAVLLAKREIPSKPLSFGDWEELAWRLAILVPSKAPTPIVRLRDLLVRSGAQRSRLSESIKGAVRLRNDFQHRASGRDEESYLKEETSLSELWTQVVAGCAPLAATRLVSVAEILSFDDEDEVKYHLHVHTGPGEFFPVVSEALPQRLAKEWCYLLADRMKPLCLAPFVFAHTCDKCGRLEVCVSEGLVIGPKGAPVRGCGVTSSHEATATIPGLKALQALHARVTKA